MSSPKSSSKKQRASLRTKPAAIKDPKGGLTKAGREYLAKTEGAHLKPGVKKGASAMTPEEMKRKGS